MHFLPIKPPALKDFLLPGGLFRGWGTWNPFLSPVQIIFAKCFLSQPYIFKWRKGGLAVWHGIFSYFLDFLNMFFLEKMQVFM